MSLEIIQTNTIYKPEKNIDFNHHFYKDVNVLKDFDYNSGNLTIAKYYLSPMIRNINMGDGYDNFINFNSLLPNIKYEANNSISNLCNSFYQSKHPWNNPNMSGGFLITSSLPTRIAVSGEPSDYVKVYGVEPTYFTIYNTRYSEFNFDNFEYIKNASIIVFDNDFYTTGIITNWETNDLMRFDNKLYYGGISQTNQIEIDSYFVKNKIDFNLGFTSTFGMDLSLNTNSGCLISYNPLHNLIISEIQDVSGIKKVKKTLHQYNFTNEFYKDNLIHINCPLDNPVGFLDLEYFFYVQKYSGLYDFLPKGYIQQSGTQNLVAGFSIPGTVIRDAYKSISSKIVSHLHSGVKTVFSSGYIKLHTASSIADYESILNTLSPYGVKCKGSNLLDMMIYVNGSIDSVNLSKAIDFEDYEYYVSELKLNVKTNNIENLLNSHGAINSTGQLLWSDNHGVSRIKYRNIINGTGIVNYTTTNLIPEIYRIENNVKNNLIVFTGNLVNDYEPPVYDNLLIEDFSYNYDISGNIQSDNYNLIPINQIVSNFTYPSGYIEAKLNKKSLGYGMVKTSNIVCGEHVFIPSSIIFSTGEVMDNIPSKMNGFGYINGRIFTSGAK